MLEQLGMIGVSWRQGGAESLAEFVLPDDDAEERLRAFAEQLGLAELAYLSTCNRVELIFAREERAAAADIRPAAFELLVGREPASGEAARRLRAWNGEGAAEHLFLIAAGLDSACVGETEIVAQVRVCHEQSTRLGLSGAALELLFGEALRIAARVRGATALGAGRVSLAEIAVARLREHLARTAGTAALLGVSAMTERAAVSLSTSGIPLLVVNRSAERAQSLAGRFGAAWQSLEAFRTEPAPVEALLAATAAPGPVLEQAALERIAARTPSGEPPLIVDMAVPPDVDPTACAKLAIPRVGLDEIVRHAERNRAARLMEAAEAREQVDEALATLRDRYTERYYGPLFGALQKRYRITAQEGVKRLFRKELEGLGEEERAAVEVWCEVLARRFAHIPCLGLRGLLHAGPEGSLEAFLSGLEPEFADELRAALDGSAAQRDSAS